MSEANSGEMPVSPVKRFVKNLLRSVGLDLIRYQPSGAAPINLLELAIRSALLARKDFFFIQVGANDGVRHDPIYEHVREYRLRGLLIEPLPDMFEALLHNYADQPQLLFKKAAVARDAGTLTLTRFRSDAPVDDDLHGLTTADDARLRRFARANQLEEYLEQISVPCVSFEELMDEFQLDREVDLLLIDVEGQEWELLQAAFDAGLAPRIIFMEFLHLLPYDRGRAEVFLAERGYALAYTGIDLIALHPRHQAAASNLSALVPWPMAFPLQEILVSAACL